MFLILLCVFLFVVFLAKQRFLTWWQNLPPGPWRFPLMGSFPTMYKSHPDPMEFPYQAMYNLSKIYGPVMSVGLGSDTWVVLSSFDSVRQFAMMDETISRPASSTFDELYSFNKPLGVIFTDGNLWKEQRRFMISTLREMGMGKQAMEQHITDELHYCTHHLASICKQKSTAVVEMDKFFDLPCLNVIWRLICGRRFNYDDVGLRDIIGHIESFTMEKSIGPIIGVWYLKYLPPFSSVYVRLKKQMDLFKSYLWNTVQSEKSNSQQEGYMGAFFAKQQSGTGQFFTDQQLTVSIEDFFTGGSGTMSKTLAYSILYLLHYPHVQSRVHREVKAALLDSNSTEVTVDMRPFIPYTEAVMMEVQRLASVLPIAPPRVATKDVQVEGYTIKKGSQVQMNLYAMHRDATHWGDPMQFRPDRFINPNGTLTQDEWLQPFGYGKRKCLGENVARNTVLMFLANLVYRFRFEVPEHYTLPNTEPRGGLTIGPQAFVAKVICIST